MTDKIHMATNYRDLGGRWHETNGAGLASLLMLFGGRYGAGLIGSTDTYRSMPLLSQVPAASNPITDPLLSSQSFKIIHDGASFSRAQKIQALADWPEAMQYLRVCWNPTAHHLNCGKCRKCTRTILEFRAAGLPLPSCFAQDINNWEIVTITGGSEVIFLREIVEAARANGVSGSWVGALYLRWWYSRLRLWGKHMLGRKD